MKIKVTLLALLLILVFACDNSSKSGVEKSTLSLKEAPASNVDSLLRFVADQVAFGPRVPNTEAHNQTANWLKQKFESYGAKVQFQEWEDYVYDGTKVNLKNIIASINPTAKKRIMLSAHWDTRPFSDQCDTDKYAPIDGANDGASGVAVLLEVARILARGEATVGVDIILFDGEDWGEHVEEQGNSLPEGLESWYCLGSQYWSKNKHKPNYSAYYGILLDMVGAKDATFYYDSISKQFALRTLEKVWSNAHALGYQSTFIKADGFGGIIDDHVYVNQNAKIPMIDIIDFRPDGGTSQFAPAWHTQNDNLENIEKATLEKVANVLLSVLYNE